MEGYSQADILAALQRQSAAPPPPAKQYKDLDQTDLHDGSENKVNTRKLYCPREGCRAVIVQPGTCELIEAKPDLVSILFTSVLLSGECSCSTRSACSACSTCSALARASTPSDSTPPPLARQL